ncbi:hypothetical protein Cadr_000021390 [Camelus dromedarius]|nr:hypothetical protein Cadr_000021390 [Camelus dromedarius]
MLSVASDRNPTQKIKVKKGMNILAYLVGRNSLVGRAAGTRASKLEPRLCCKKSLYPYNPKSTFFLHPDPRGLFSATFETGNPWKGLQLAWLAPG